MMTLLTGVLFLQISFGIIYLYKIRSYFNTKLQKLEQEQLKLKKDLRMVGSGAVGVGQRVNKIEDYMQRLASRQDVTELKQGATASYAHAAKIVKIGGSVEDIIEGCGLTHAEAELVAMLHKTPGNRN